MTTVIVAFDGIGKFPIYRPALATTFSFQI